MGAVRRKRLGMMTLAAVTLALVGCDPVATPDAGSTAALQGEIPPVHLDLDDDAWSIHSTARAAGEADPSPSNALARTAEEDVRWFNDQRERLARRDGSGGGETEPGEAAPADGPGRRDGAESVVFIETGPASSTEESAPPGPERGALAHRGSTGHPPAGLAGDPPFTEPAPTLGAVSPRERDRSVSRLLTELTTELYQEAAYADVPLRELMVIAATSMLDPERAVPAENIPGLTPRERQVLTHFQAFYSELGRALDGEEADPNRIITDAVVKLRESLRTEPPLTVVNAALCTRVRGFGDYDAFPRYTFLAHESQRAIVYLEFEHFTSEQNPASEWVTELSQELTIYAERDGVLVWTEPWQKAVDQSKTQRRDFFTVQIITLPRALSVGKYHLKVRVRDERSGALAETSLPFEMVADPRLVTPTK